MKKIIILFAAVIGFTVAANAQVNVSINIGSQPAWGPTGYDHVDYYYLPDIDCYYDVPNKVYVYPDNNSWRRSRTLPSRYGNFDVYNSHKVVINGVNKPYLQNDRYRKEYSGFKGKHDQTPIRDSRDEKYFVNRNHPQHAQWAKDHKNDNRGKGNNNRNNDNRGHNRNSGRR